MCIRDRHHAGEALTPKETFYWNSYRKTKDWELEVRRKHHAREALTPEETTYWNSYHASYKAQEAKLKQARIAANYLFLENNPHLRNPEPLPSQDELRGLVDAWYNTIGEIPEFPLLTALDAIMVSKKIFAYIGVTKRRLSDEDTGFMKNRGSPLGNGIISRPVLTKPDGSIYTNMEVRNDLNVKSKFIYFNKNRFPTRVFEDFAQLKINSMELPHRLHRAISVGQFNDPDCNDPDYLCKTYITYFIISRPIWYETVDGVVMKFVGINGHKVKVNGRTYDREEDIEE